MDPEPIRQLYQRIRGTKAAMVVFEAFQLCTDRKFELAKVELSRARELYSNGRKRFLRAAKEARAPHSKVTKQERSRLDRKEQKINESLGEFDRLIDQINEAIALQAKRQKRSSKAKPKHLMKELEQIAESIENEGDEIAANVPKTPDKKAHKDEKQNQVRSMPLDEFARLFSSAPSEQSSMLRERFRLKRIRTVDDIRPNALYCLRSKGKNRLVRTSRKKVRDGLVKLIGLDDGQQRESVPLAKLMLKGKTGKFVRLAKRAKSKNLGRRRHRDGFDASKKRPFHLDAETFATLGSAIEETGISFESTGVSVEAKQLFEDGQLGAAHDLMQSLFREFRTKLKQTLEQVGLEFAEIASSGRDDIASRLAEKRQEKNRLDQKIDASIRLFSDVIHKLEALGTEPEPSTSFG